MVLTTLPSWFSVFLNWISEFKLVARWLQATHQLLGQIALHPAACTLQDQSPGFSSLSTLLGSPPARQWEFPLPIPGLGHPVCGLTPSLLKVGVQSYNLNFLWVPSQGYKSWPYCFPSLPTQLCVYLSYHFTLVVWESFCQFPVNFQWELFHM